MLIREVPIFVLSHKNSRVLGGWEGGKGKGRGGWVRGRGGCVCAWSGGVREWRRGDGGGGQMARGKQGMH